MSVSSNQISDSTCTKIVTTVVFDPLLSWKNIPEQGRWIPSCEALWVILVGLGHREVKVSADVMEGESEDIVHDEHRAIKGLEQESLVEAQRAVLVRLKPSTVVKWSTHALTSCKPARGATRPQWAHRGESG